MVLCKPCAEPGMKGYRAIVLLPSTVSASHVEITCVCKEEDSKRNRMFCEEGMLGPLLDSLDIRPTLFLHMF